MVGSVTGGGVLVNKNDLLGVGREENDNGCDEAQLDVGSVRRPRFRLRRGPPGEDLLSGLVLG